MPVQKITLTLETSENNAQESLRSLIEGHFNGRTIVGLGIEEVVPTHKAFVFSDGTRLPMHTALSGATAISSLINEGRYCLENDDLTDLEEEVEITSDEYADMIANMTRNVGFIPDTGDTRYLIWFNGETPVWVEPTSKDFANDRECELVVEWLLEKLPTSIEANDNIFVGEDEGAEFLEVLVRPFELIPEQSAWTYYLLKDAEGDVVGTMSTKKILKTSAEVRAYAQSLDKGEFATAENCEFNAYKSAKEGVTYGDKKTYKLTFDSEVQRGSQTSNTIQVKSKFDLVEADAEWVVAHITRHLEGLQLGEATLTNVEVEG